MTTLPTRRCGLTFWGSDCVLDGGCDGNTTPDSMVCDNCKTDEHTVALWQEGHA